MPLVLPPDLKPSSFLTIEEAAALVNVKVRWMRDAVVERRIGHYKIGHLVRIQVADLFGLLASSWVQPGSRTHPADQSGKKGVRGAP